MKAYVPFRTVSLVSVIVTIGALTILASDLISVQEAPTGFTTPTNCPTTNLPPGVALCSGNGFPEPSGNTMAANQQVFEEQEDVTKGLGPVYNDTSCLNCHQNPVTGGASQVSDLRVGHTDAFGNFVNPSISINHGQTTISNRSLVNDRAVCPQAQERTPSTESIRALRMSLSTLGDGFVEAIADSTLQSIAHYQSLQTGGRIHGEAIEVPVFMPLPGMRSWPPPLMHRQDSNSSVPLVARCAM